MKKRGFIGVLVGCMLLALTGCDMFAAPTVKGEWEAELEMKDMIVQTMDEETKKYAEYFDGLELDVTFEFDEDEVEVRFEEDSVDEFIEDFEEALKKMCKAVLEDSAASMGMNLETFLAMAGMTMDNYIDLFMKQINMDEVTDNIKDELEEKYDYELDEEEGIIKATDKDGNVEEWEYELEKDKLNITVKQEGITMEFECERK